MNSMKKNLVYQSAYQILTMILPLITTPYIARVLGAENSGIYSYTYIIANYFVVFSMLGLEQYGNRSIARVRDSKSERDTVFSELVILHIIVSAVVVLVYFGMAMLWKNSYREIMLIQGLYVISSVFDINWFYFGIEKFQLTVTRNLIIKLGSVLCIFLLVHKKEDLWIYTLIMSLGNLFSQMALWICLSGYVSFVKISKKKVWNHMKPLMVLFVAVIAAHIYRMIDKLMLGWFGKMTQLGCYEYADKIIRIPLGLITALGTVMLSRMSNLVAKEEREESERLLKDSGIFVIAMTVAMAFGLAGIAPEFIPLFLGVEYMETVVLLIILTVSIPLIGWNNFIRTQVLIPGKKDMVYTRAVLVGALVNFMLNLVLIYFYDARGAAAATIFSYLAVMVIQMLPVFRQPVLKETLQSFPVYLLFGLVMYVFVRLIGKSMGVSIVSVALEILVGGLLYGGLCLLHLFRHERDLLHSIIRGFL